MKKLRKKVMAIALAFALGVSASAALPSMSTTTVASAATVKLSQTKVSLKVGQTKQLKLTGAKKTITWSSSKKSVAAVSKSGKVTAKAAGTATITAKLSGKKYTCKVTVTEKKADNQTCTYKALTFKIPNNITTEETNAQGIEMCLVSSQDSKELCNIVILDVQNYEGLNVSYDQWADYIKENLSKESQDKQLKGLLDSEAEIGEYSQEVLETKLGKGFLTKLEVKYQGNRMYTTYSYDVLANDHWYEITLNNYDTTTEVPSLQSVFDMILNTIEIKK